MSDHQSTSTLNPTTHAGIPQMMVRTLAHYGVDGKTLMAELDDPSSQSNKKQGRVASKAMQQIWRAAVDATGDEAFGLTFAKQLHPAALHGLGLACAVSDTMYDALRRIARYYRVIVSAGEILLTEEEDRLRLWYQIPAKPGAAVPASIDAALALFLQFCRITADETYSPVLVEMQRSRPTDTTPFDTFFGCTIRYGCEENVMYFELDSLNAPLPMANPELARASDRVIIEYLDQYDQSDIIGKVRARIIDSLPGGTPSQETIAKTLHMSPRTLQRKLGAVGDSFSEILESVRSDLARQYLASGNRSIGEVAYLLGFSEPANFSRSFKRWAGKSPAQYRDETRSH